MVDNEKLLDEALSGGSTPDGETAALTAIGENIRRAYEVVSPPHSGERALFVQGVGIRRRALGWWRVFTPATVTVMLLLVILLLGRLALPGETLYPVREVLRSVGLAPATTAEIERQLDQVERLLDRATDLQARDLDRAKGVALVAVRLLGGAEEMMEDLDQSAVEGLSARADALLKRAGALLAIDEPEEETRAVIDDDAARRDDEDGDAGENEGEDDEDDEDDTQGSGAANEERTDDPTSGGDETEGRDETRQDDDDDGGGNSGPGGDTQQDDADDDGDNSGPGSGDADDDTADTSDLDEQDEEELPESPEL